jgi:hypothetical protein
LLSGTGSYSSGVFGGLNRLAVAGIIAGALLAAPSAAVASGGCSGGPSAEHVYTECIPSGSGGKPTSAAKTKASKGSTGSTAPLPVPKRLRRVLAHAKGDKRLLESLVTNPGFGASRGLKSTGSTAATAPSALGSAFDLGSGPTALLALLAATAVLLLGGSGFRVWRHRHRA